MFSKSGPKVTRPSRIETNLGYALLASRRGTCVRRQVGCVLVNRQQHVIAIGHNGVPQKQQHCTDVNCPGAGLPSGTGLSKCEAIHAEINALLQCNAQEVDAVFCTDSPCDDCIKVLLNTPAQHIYFLREYPHPEAKRRWVTAGRHWHGFPNLTPADLGVVA